MRWRKAAIASGLLIAGVSSVAVAAPTQPLELENPIEPWTNCSACHNFPNPVDHAGEPSVAPMAWQGTMMANSAKDPVFWAALALAYQDFPDETTTCVRCHAPAAFLAGEGSAISADEISEDLRGGVECEFCHRLMEDVGVDPGNAQYTIDDAAVDGTVPRRGPWSYEQGEPAPPHPWSDDSSFIASSAMCGMCHDVTTGRERVDAGGQPMGVMFNEQRTYSEWLGSVFARPGADFSSCQDCHMPAVDDVAGCETLSLVGDTHESGRRHDLVGANRHSILLVRELYGSAGVHEVPDFHFDRTIEVLDEFLRSAATLDVTVADEIDASQGFDLQLTVTNDSGHKLPTGYSEGRVMWLEITGRLGDELLWGSGVWDDDTGLDPDDSTTRRYEAIAEASEDGTQLHLLRNDRWVVDNRLPPRGLAPDIETDPVGDRYTLTAEDVWPHWDDVAYTFDPLSVVDPTPGEDDELLLRVRLLYLINTPEYFDTLEADNITNDAGESLRDLLETVGPPEPMVVAEFERTIPLVGLEPAATDESDTGTPSDDTTSTTSTPSTSGETAAPDDGTTAGGDSGSTTGAPPETGGSEGCGCRSDRPTALPLLLWIVLFRRRR